MITIETQVASCRECPHCKLEPYYTSDSFETASNWYCKKENGKKISGYIEWHEEKKVKIPDWCPYRTSSAAANGSNADV